MEEERERGGDRGEGGDRKNITLLQNSLFPTPYTLHPTPYTLI